MIYKIYKAEVHDLNLNQHASSTFISTVEEDESAMPKKDSRLLLAKFNDQMEKLYELLRAVEDIRLAPEVTRQYAGKVFTRSCFCLTILQLL